ncbi:hypothetical protein [Methylobacterium sp. J-076]|nr:hypothetical protein [Methylobacterium sp. J-076]MCJ2011277.1 hypothetical protein [Methylobacterium sp. J-076]
MGYDYSNPENRLQAASLLREPKGRLTSWEAVGIAPGFGIAGGSPLEDRQ